MAELLPLPASISQSSSKTKKTRLLTAQFGQGYAQYTKDGPNSQYDEWRIVYTILTTSDRDTILTFFNTVGCDAWFYWTAPGDLTQKKWRITVDTYNETVLSGDLYAISFTILQQFDLGV